MRGEPFRTARPLVNEWDTETYIYLSHDNGKFQPFEDVPPIRNGDVPVSC